MDLSKILTISGKPGLFKLISQTKTGALVESLIDAKRCPVFATDKISSLEEISILCTDEDTLLKTVFETMYNSNKEGITITSLSEKEIKELFKQFVPNYDADKVYFSDMKKVFTWYNLLLSKDLITIEEKEAEQTENE